MHMQKAGRRKPEVNVNLPALKSHIRSNIQDVLHDMETLVDQKDLNSAKKEYVNLLEAESLLKDRYPQLDILISGIVETQKSPRKGHEEGGRSRLRDLLVRSTKEPSVSRYTSGTAMYEYNSLKTVREDNYDPMFNPKRSTMMEFTPRNKANPASRGRRGSLSSNRTSVEEIEGVLRTVEYQQSKIDQLTKRLQQTDFEENIDEKAIQLAKQFEEVYSYEWKTAWREMNRWLKDKQAEITYNLLRVVRFAYEFCRKAAAEQILDLTKKSVQPLIQPIRLPYMESQPSIEQRAILSSTGVKYAKRYRREVAAVSLPQLSQKFKEQVIRPDFGWDPDKLPPYLSDYIDKVVEVLWLMSVQDPPMFIDWPIDGSTLDSDKYKVYSGDGSRVQQCVWPCVYVSGNGPLLSKGYVIVSRK
ncbi:hypothetical protein FSP39_018692 [Pinctada imbricata]|uniref:Mitochondria-eating protein C-terminal domain-containing protein n=1 Tax=Pinctada imbricata TaxID=66713 RepID=A0AA88YJ16_PINIB|nr:hypothetical protein FSP39_018692 [Pinctada imbricata]